MYAFFKRTITRELLPIIIFSGSIFFVTLIGVEFIVPLVKNIIIVRERVNHYQSLIRGSSEYKELKDDIREKQKELEKKHTEITQGLADPHDLSGLLQMIFDKAWEANIRFEKTLPQNEFRGKDYIHYPVILEMITSYKALGKFISSLERIPQIVHVDRLAINADESNDIQARILITCFLRLKE